MPRLPLGGLLRAAKKAGRASGRASPSKKPEAPQERPWRDSERRELDEFRARVIEQWNRTHPDGPEWRWSAVHPP